MSNLQQQRSMTNEENNRHIGDGVRGDSCACTGSLVDRDVLLTNSPIGQERNDDEPE